MKNELIEVQIKDVVSNHDNAREPAPTLQSLGYGLCEPVKGANKPTLFALALGSSDDKKTYCALVDAHEPAVAEFAGSLRKRGLFNSCRVRAVEGGYALVAGARRVLAVLYEHARTGGEYPAVVPATVSRAGEQDALLESFDENYHRANPSPIDEARLFARLMKEYGWSLRDVEENCGLRSSYQTVRNRLELLKLSEEDQWKVHAGLMSMKAALQKVARPDPAKQPKGRTQPPVHPDDDDPEGPPHGDAADYFAKRDWAEDDGRRTGQGTPARPDTDGGDGSELGGATTSPEPPDQHGPKGRPAGRTGSATGGTPPAPASGDTPPPRVTMLPTFQDDPGTLPKQFQKKLVAQFVAWLLEP